MRHLLHLGLFAAVLVATTQANADDDRDDRREARVVVARDHGPRHVRHVRVDTRPVRVVYDSPRRIPDYRRAPYDFHRDYRDQRQDLEQIRRIAWRWERAVSYGDYPAIRIADARLDAWLEREIYESMHEPYSERYTQRIRALSEELAFLEKRVGRVSHGQYGHRGYKKGRGHAKGHAYGYGRQRVDFYFQEKARILDALVRLSERQVRRAQANLDRPVFRSYVYR